MQELFSQAFGFALIHVEIIAVVLSMVYIFLCIFQNNWCWLFGGLGAALYIPTFYINGFYADMSLQFYYVAISFYGWYYWKFGKHKKTEKTIPIIRANRKAILQLSIVGLFVFGAYVLVLMQTDSKFVWGDSFVTATAIVATYMLSKKYIENWIVFLVSDAAAIALFMCKEMYPTVILTAIYTGMCFWGYADWYKDLKKQEVEGNKI
jgi:nicotinamide mononucleotide transporter